jgi:hypothetical protein
MRTLIWLHLISLWLLALVPVCGQHDTQLAAIDMASEKPAGYYIIKLRYLSVGQITAYFKAGGEYARYIPPSVERIVGMPSLQSIALKSGNPEDVLTLTRLITQLDHPAQSYDITCTVVITSATVPPPFPEQFATLSADEFTARVRRLVLQQQASLLTYPNLHIDLTADGEIVSQEGTAAYQLTRDSVVILPSAYCPAMPAFRISHLPPAANAPTSGRFAVAGRQPDDGTHFVMTKGEARNTVTFSYTGRLAQEQTLQRIYVLVTVSSR